MSSNISRKSCIKISAIYEDELKNLALLSVFDVLVMPSVRMSTTSSNIPIKLLEAWALGMPVVITKHKIFESLVWWTINMWFSANQLLQTLLRKY